jgi:hypothetical protein
LANIDRVDHNIVESVAYGGHCQIILLVNLAEATKSTMIAL